MWDSIIVPLINYCKEKDILNKKVKFGITTNGILLDDKMMDFLIENDISLLFSIDGTKETQDFNRPCANENLSSFDILEPKIATIATKFHPTFRGTLLPETCDNFFNNIMFASKFDFTNCFFIPDWSNTGWTEEKINILRTEIHKYSLYFIDSYRRGKIPFDLSSYTRQFEKIKGYIEYKKYNKIEQRDCGHCGLGTTGAGVGYNGELYACQELPSLGTENNLYYIGDIYNGIIEEKRRQLLNQYLDHNETCEGDAAKCDSCSFKFACSSNSCHANCWMRCGDLNSKSNIECFWDSETMNEALFVARILIKNCNLAFIKKYNFNQEDIQWILAN